MALPRTHYRLADDLVISRIIVGLWQTSSGHTRDTTTNTNKALEDMNKYVSQGLTTFDGADHYGPAEQLMGLFRKSYKGKPLFDPVYMTKWVPRPQNITAALVQANIDLSLKKMQTDTIDVLQFHWWDYGDDNYIKAMQLMKQLQQGPSPKIRHLALTNFDTDHIAILVQAGIKIVSNQVSYSIIDRRPEKKMIELCRQHDIKLVTYGTVMGGLLSDKYLNKPEPKKADLFTWSLSKYKPWIDVWGGWELFQVLLQTLRQIANKHNCSIANIAVAYVLQKPQVAGVIVGARLGVAEHIEENLRAVEIELDADDHSAINAVLKRGRELRGDCGDEYRYENIP